MPFHFCCDPYNRHKKQISKNVRLPKAELVEAVNDLRLTSSDYLCDNCRKKLTDNPKSLPEEESSSSLSGSVSIEGPGSASESTGSSLADPDVSHQRISELLPSLDVSPMVGKSKCYLSFCCIKNTSNMCSCPITGRIGVGVCE